MKIHKVMLKVFCALIPVTKLNIKVIAYSVETGMELFALKNLNIDDIQGYFVGKPSENV